MIKKDMWKANNHVYFGNRLVSKLPFSKQRARSINLKPQSNWLISIFADNKAADRTVTNLTMASAKTESTGGH